MGYYRLILALLVAASHAGLTFGRFNPGEIAVVSFFLLSGYVMTALIDRHYRDFRRVGPFYLDRALRLYPQFLVYSLAMIAAAELFGLRHLWMPAPPTLTSDFAQLTMLPLAFSERFPNMLLPQAWSLGLELMFYAVFPFFLISGERMMAAYASGLVFLFAFCDRISADWFAYRLLPGVLFVFILGSWIRRPEIRLGRAPLALAYAIAVAALVVALTIWPRRTSVCDMLIGLVAGLPIVYGLSRARIVGRWDALAGKSQLRRVSQSHAVVANPRAPAARRLGRPALPRLDADQHWPELSDVPLHRAARDRMAARSAKCADAPERHGGERRRRHA